DNKGFVRYVGRESRSARAFLVDAVLGGGERCAVETVRDDAPPGPRGTGKATRAHRFHEELTGNEAARATHRPRAQPAHGRRSSRRGPGRAIRRGSPPSPPRRPGP